MKLLDGVAEPKAQQQIRQSMSSITPCCLLLVVQHDCARSSHGDISQQMAFTDGNYATKGVFTTVAQMTLASRE